MQFELRVHPKLRVSKFNKFIQVIRTPIRRTLSTDMPHYFTGHDIFKPHQCATLVNSCLHGWIIYKNITTVQEYNNCTRIKQLYKNITTVEHYLKRKVKEASSLHNWCRAVQLCVKYWITFCYQITLPSLKKLAIMSFAIDLGIGIIFTKSSISFKLLF